MIVVFGSLNMDLIMAVPALPRPGETVLCPSYSMQPGGKGNNQAVAAARAGATLRLFGRVGADDFGRALLANLQANGIPDGDIRMAPSPTGCAAITVDRAGENAITVASGANLDVRADDVPRRVGVVRAPDAAPDVAAGIDRAAAALAAAGWEVSEVEAPLLETVMNYVKGNQTKASELLGLNRGTLRKKLKQYDLL